MFCYQYGNHTVCLLKIGIKIPLTLFTNEWYLFFNKCQAEEFTKEELFVVLKKELIAYAETDAFPESSLRDDIDVMLNMYSKDIVNDDPEDKNKCPLASLKLIRKEHDVYCRQQPDMRHFRDEIILYELGQIFETENSVSIDYVAELAANIYHLSRVAVNNILDRLDNAGYITVNRTAGLDEIYPNNKISVDKIIEDYYKR